MKGKLLILSLIAITAWIFDGCIYEDGPLFSFHSADKRIEGDWRVESYTANGIDSMSYLRRYFLEGKWTFYGYKTTASPDLVVSTDTASWIGIWSTSSSHLHKNLAIELRTCIGTSNTPLFHYDTIPDWVFFSDSWRIVRLKENDMKLRKEKNGIVYEMAFKPY